MKSILDTFRPGGLIFWCRIFLAFYAVHKVLTASILEWFAVPFSVDHVLSELSAMTHPCWVALCSMAHSFIELHKPLHSNKASHEGAGKLRELNMIYIELHFSLDSE